MWQWEDWSIIVGKLFVTSLILGCNIGVTFQLYLDNHKKDIEIKSLTKLFQKQRHLSDMRNDVVKVIEQDYQRIKKQNEFYKIFFKKQLRRSANKGYLAQLRNLNKSRLSPYLTSQSTVVQLTHGSSDGFQKLRTNLWENVPLIVRP
jgi:hypothetical protein